MMLSIRLRVVLFAAVLFGLSACRNDPPGLGRPIPEYVGTWIGDSHGNKMRITMNPDGTFLADALVQGHAPARAGRWGFKEGSIRWRYDKRPHPRRDDMGGVDEINPVTTIDLNRFTLKESDGSHTTFVRQ